MIPAQLSDVNNIMPYTFSECTYLNNNILIYMIFCKDVNINTNTLFAK